MNKELNDLLEKCNEDELAKLMLFMQGLCKKKHLNKRLSVCPFCGAEHKADAAPEPGEKIRCQCGATAGVESDSKGLYLYWRAAAV